MINNSGVHSRIVLKFDTLVDCGSAEPAWWLTLKTTGGKSGLKWQCSAYCHFFICF